MEAIEVKEITRLFIISFGLFYMGFIIFRTISRKIDLFDLLLLSTIAMVPISFAFFPSFVNLMVKVTGVFFPFVVLFGMLHFFIFIHLHQLTEKLHILDDKNKNLVQEIGLIDLKYTMGQIHQNNDPK